MTVVDILTKKSQHTIAFHIPQEVRDETVVALADLLETESVG